MRTPGGHEVDFLARHPDGRQEIIQVCADAADPGTAQRGLRALAEAAPSHPHARKLLLTRTHSALPPVASLPPGTEVLAAWRGLLARQASD